ncbi:MAG: Lipid A biosynthesis acyltransferase, partial [candidate division NC10 bacterium]|nr:Lipid A biosynthesis acyltransferase [candidate division NC10 bacterium]
IDQNISVKEGVFVDFFGRPACTALAPALLALRTDASVLPAAIFRCGRDRHRIVVGEEISLIRTGQLAADLVANTAAFTKAIEAFVRREPAQWLWVHRRWKTQPLSTRLEPEGATG